MTKRLTIALVALALFVLVAVLPVSALSYVTAPGINQSATVYIGEEGLNLTHALNQLTSRPRVDLAPWRPLITKLTLPTP